jgi:transcriptional antiterminator RfaH
MDLSENQKIVIPELLGELISAEGKRWIVIYTKPRREKKLAEYALKNEIHYYLPLIDSYKVYERKRIVYKKPMFSSYIFAKVDFDQRKLLYVSGLTVSFINVENEEKLLAELMQIYNVRQRKVEVKPHQYLTKGTKVRFKEGPMKGLIGLVKDAKNVKEVVLQVNILKQAVAVSAKSNVLEVLDFYDEDDEDDY